MRRSIVGERLRAAYLAARFKSLNDLAKEVGVFHSTLSRVLSGRVKKVNQGTLTRLATALRVPDDWLTGERRDLPYVPEFDRPPPATGSRSARGRGTKQASLWERPTIDYLRYSWFMRRAEEAVRRDLAEWFGDNGEAAYKSWGWALLRVIGAMASSLVWRWEAHSTTPRVGWNRASGAEDVPTINWLEHILGPWLAGEGYLQAEFIRDVYQALIANSRSIWSDEIRDADALRALHSYAERDTEVEAERLEAAHTWEEDDDGSERASSKQRSRKKARGKGAARRGGRGTGK